jgi:hypothetical protein
MDAHLKWSSFFEFRSNLTVFLGLPTLLLLTELSDEPTESVFPPTRMEGGFRCWIVSISSPNVEVREVWSFFAIELPFEFDENVF